MSPQSTATDVQYIKLPDGSYGKFRADAGDTDIMAQIEKDFPGTYRPGIPRPQVNMEGETKQPGATDSLSAAGRSPRQPTAKIQILSGASRIGDRCRIGGVAAGTAAATAPTTLPFLGRQALSTGKGLAKGLPWLIGKSLLSKGIQYARTNVPGGKFLPPGAELVPFLSRDKVEGQRPKKNLELRQEARIRFPAGRRSQTHGMSARQSQNQFRHATGRYSSTAKFSSHRRSRENK